MHRRGAVLRLMIPIALLTCAVPAQAAGFRTFGQSAAGLGAADALGADAEHAGSVAYNPAGLAFQEGAKLELALQRYKGKIGDKNGSKSREGHSWGRHSLFATYRGAGSMLGYGLSLTRPFRLDSDWGDNFGSGAVATETKLKLWDWNPNVALRLEPGLALSLGAEYYQVQRFVYSTAATTRDGDGDGWGGRVGLMFWREGGSVALTHSTAAELDLSGDNLDGTQMTLPPRTRLGIKFRPDLSWSVHLDVVRTDWSQYKGLENSSLPEKEWQPAYGYRTAALLRLSDGAELRFGYAYDADPKDRATFDPRSLVGKRHTLTAGFGWETGAYKFNFGYGHTFWQNREVSGAGQPAYDTRYKSNERFMLFSVGHDFE
jgi:long-subunit fatty acid transport protein